MQILKWAAIILLGSVGVIILVIIGVGFFLSPQSDLQKADVIVAVSGGETQQRTREAVKLYDEGYAPKLLFSGAAEDKNGPSNAAAMRLQALDEGVPNSAIIVEEQSTTTAENAVRSAPILQALGARTIILVTSPYHQRRASINFRKVLGHGVTIINHSASDSTWRKNSWWSKPYTLQLSLSELQKIIYEVSTKPAGDR
jgi:uncharacterized SAM-binding protein YcdF (DUF218 family)